jgi:hypothetical protein
VIQRRNPLKRSTKRIPTRRAKPRRGPLSIPPEEWRNPAYRQFLREEGRCVACPSADYTMLRKYLTVQCDPAHGPPNGKGSKGPDAGCIPLCRAHHEEQHQMGWPAFEAQYGFNREREAAAWWKAFQIWKEAQ